ncbi:APC family permease [Metabacillus halosaccharovorans]|uniref:APC family permease n=1 Tax=Metabacillus halosaccharovorans TaxID=930124 RepID=A0ABT3DBW2_9BACI|nr:APC family permease [Metabacillus halosaccharovorans]MCV9884318.1 APC family permease [Metabacillus halosaccharovorans]
MKTDTPELKKSLNTFGVVFLGLAWMTPMIFFTVYGVAFEAAGGMLAAAYVVAFIAIFFTAYSYSRMVKAYPISGSAYTYTKKAVNQKMGFLVGWALLLDYIVSPIIACLTFGLFLNAQFPSIPVYVWIIVLNLILAFVNIIGIKSVARVSGFSVIFQVIFIVFFCVFVTKDILTGGDGMALFSMQPFISSDFSIGTIFSGAALICFCFLGFDAVTTMAEETVNPRKTIPRAIFLIVCIAAVLYITIAYLTEIAYPDFTFVNSNTASAELIQMVGGNLLSAIFTTVLIVATFTQGVSSVTSVTRFLLALGRESILPNKVFGYIHPKFKTPVLNIVFVTIISFFSIAIDLDTAVTFVSFGALTAFTFVNISVIAHYYVRQKQRSFKETFLYLIFPLVGACFIGWLLTLLEKQTLLIGIGWIVLGFVYLGIRTVVLKKPVTDLVEDKVAIRNQLTEKSM